MKTLVTFIKAHDLQWQPPVPSLGGFLLACIARDLFVAAAPSEAPPTAPHRSGVSATPRSDLLHAL